MNDTQRALAEFIGTFTLVLIGAGAGALAGPSGGNGGLVAVALAHGIALMVIVYAWGAISGAHVNPAVTFGVLIGGKMDWQRALLYWIAQMCGAAAAAFLLKWLIGMEGDLGQTIGRFTKGDAADVGKTIVVEGVLTFFLVIAVYGSAIAGRNGNAAGLAIGFVLAMDILFGGPLTGASMNPARTFGPALAAGDFSYFWMYVVGPLAGGGLAGIIYSSFFMPQESH